MDTLEIILSIITSIIAVIGGIWALFKFVFKLGQEKEHLASFEDETRKGFNNLAARLDKMDDTIQSHNISINTINTFLRQKFPKSDVLFSGKASPRALNERGKKLFADVDGENFLLANKETLFKSIDDMRPLTKLDVESDALIALTALTESPVFNHIKDIVYEMPEITIDGGKKYEVTLGNVCYVLSIPLRDMYIKEKGM